VRYRKESVICTGIKVKGGRKMRVEKVNVWEEERGGREGGRGGGGG